MSPLALLAENRYDTQVEMPPLSSGEGLVPCELDYRGELVRSLSTIAGPLERVEGLLAESLRAKRGEVQPLLDYVAGLGGKRLRPALLLLTAQAIEAAGGRAVSDEAVRLAVVVELVHTATLVHDDVLDAAALRRHRPTVHQRWDVPRAILVGDWLFTQAYSLANAGDSTVPGRWVAAAAKAVCEGEIQQDVAAEARGGSSESQYLRMLAGKTGALCAVSCSLGAWAAGADTTRCQEMYDFGMKLGVAFQIHDDWLDIYGDPAKTGKPLGGDLAGGKWTLSVLRFMDAAEPRDRTEMLRIIGSGEAAERIETVRELLDRYAASEYARQFAVRLVRQANDSLEALPQGAERAALQRLAAAAVHRCC